MAIQRKIEYKIENEPVKLTKKENSLVLWIHGKNMKLPAVHASQVKIEDGETINGTLSVEIMFDVKTTKNKGQKVIRSDDGDGISSGNLVVKFNDVELGDFGGDTEFYSINNGDVLDNALCDILDGRIERGDLKEIITREGEDWNDEEEDIAFDIYQKSGSDYALMLNLIEEAVKHNQIMRSKDAVEMKVNQYKSIDKNAGVEGLKNISSKTRENWEKRTKS